MSRRLLFHIFKRLLPYRVRLWWMARKLPVCICPNPGVAPWLHEHGCPVAVEYRADLASGVLGGVAER